MKKYILCLFLLALTNPAHAEPVKLKKMEKLLEAPQPSKENRKKVFNAETFTLDNGMEIVVIPKTNAPVVTHMLWYKVGSADEPRGKSGIAHFLEHLMFKGSKRIEEPPLAPGEFSKIIRRLGGNDNAFTSHDFTAFYQSVPADKLESVMKMEAGRINGINPPESEVESERKVVLEERKQRTDNDPRAQFQEQLGKALFGNNPYGTPVIGWENEIKALSYTDAKSFYDRWYAPNNAILVVSGDVPPAKVFDLAIRIYGPLPAEPLPERKRAPSSLPAAALPPLTLHHAAVHEPVVQILSRAPSAHTDKAASLALTVLAEVMGGGPTSRLYKSLVARQKIATNVDFSYDGAAWDDGTLYVYATPAQNVSLETVEKAIQKEFRKLIKQGITPEELQEAGSRLKDEATFALDSLTGPAMVFGQALATGSSIDDVEYWPDDIASVTAEQVQSVAAQYLNPDKPALYPPVTGYLLPQDAKPAEKPAEKMAEKKDVNK